MSKNIVTLAGVKKLYKMGSEIVAALLGQVDSHEYSRLPRSTDAGLV